MDVILYNRKQYNPRRIGYQKVVPTNVEIMVPHTDTRCHFHEVDSAPLLLKVAGNKITTFFRRLESKWIEIYESNEILPT